jgi:superfamily II helicase
MAVLKQTLYFAFSLCCLEETTWTKTGVMALKHLGEEVKKQETSEKRLKNLYDLTVLKTVNIASLVSKACRLQMNEYSEKVRKTRDSLSEFIDYIKLCSKCELRSNDETLTFAESWRYSRIVGICR